MPEVMEKANKKVSILLNSCSSQDDSAMQQCGSYQTFTRPKKLQLAEIAGCMMESGNMDIVE